MGRPRVATLPKRRRQTLSDILASAPAEPPNVVGHATPADDASAFAPTAPNRPHKGPGAKLWGFVRRHEDIRDKVTAFAMMPQDIAIWYDKKRNRFEIVADHKVIDDLAPVEFVQFVRKLRYSATRILFKFESRSDGTAGRPVCVWSAPIKPDAA
jgi:hypothetical protein